MLYLKFLILVSPSLNFTSMSFFFFDGITLLILFEG